jgi:5-methylcytosine-specific restriction endonuclease McrA
MSHVLVIDQNKTPLNPVHPGRARMLLSAGKAAVFRRYPFTLILKEVVPHPMVVPLRLKIDPGSQTTGLVAVNDASGEVVWAAELSHRGQQVKDHLAVRCAHRRGRRARHTRYRPPRFANRVRPKGWLPPSLLSRIQNVLTWVQRLRRYAPITALSQELVRFDTQLLQNAEISGIRYQQGVLRGYEVREYLLEKWCRTCAYCGIKAVPLQVEHIVPRVRHGSDRISNLTLACEPCNTRKGTRTAEEFGYPHIQVQAQRPLRDAAAVNTTRWALYEQLHATGLPVETGTGGRTKWNRTQRQLQKMHWLDAACVGASTPAHLHTQQVVPLQIRAIGRQRRQMCLMDKFGFPRTKGKGPSVVQGFRSGDMARAVIPAGIKVGTYVGRVAVRERGHFDLTTPAGTVQGLNAKYFTAIHRMDGYAYHIQKKSSA